MVRCLRPSFHQGIEVHWNRPALRHPGRLKSRSPVVKLAGLAVQFQAIGGEKGDSSESHDPKSFNIEWSFAAGLLRTPASIPKPSASAKRGAIFPER